VAELDGGGRHVQMRFYLRGLLALVALLLLTLMMTAAPEVNAVRAMIVGGLVIVGGKMLMVHYRVWPRKRHPPPSIDGSKRN
jgi:hypothetical protein